MRKLLCYMLFALAAAACIYPYEAELPSDIPQRLVVYGDIIIGEATQIELGYVRPLDQSIGDSPRVPQGSVRIECDNGKYYLGKTRGDGRFTFDTEEAAEDARYRILVKLKDGREYTMPWTGVNQAPEITDLY